MRNFLGIDLQIIAEKFYQKKEKVGQSDYNMNCNLSK